MNATTHAFTMNGRINSELKNSSSPETEILRRVALLDGEQRYSLSLWRLPHDINFENVDLKKWPREYVQTAGSHDRLIVEFRVDVDGSLVQFAVGKNHREGLGLTEVVNWNGFESTVQSSEILTGSEVGEIFVSYYNNGEIPFSYALRELIF